MGKQKEAKVDYNNIYLIKKHKAKYINLYYYEVFFEEEEQIKKIVVSILLASNLPKKLKKDIKVIKEEDVFCAKLPKPEDWLD